MSNSRNWLHPGMTAIAAVLATSSTPLLAQSADAPGAALPAPVLMTPLPVTAVPTPPPDAPAVAVTVPQISAAPGTEPGVSSTAIVANRSVAAAPEPAIPAVQPRKQVVRTSVRVEAARAARAAHPSTPPAPVVHPAPPAAAPVAKTPAPVIGQTSVTRSEATDDMLPTAGAAALTLLAIGGGAVAFSRRRKRDDDEDILIDAPVAPAEPFRPERSPAPAGDLPAAFDLSRFGRHTQAAYRGPSKENPSLSLKRRLKRASFFDQRERMAAAERTAEENQPHAPPLGSQLAPAQQSGGHVTTRIARPARPVFRPAYSS